MKKIILMLILVVALLTLGTANVFGLTAIHNCAELQDMENNLAEDYELANNIDCSSFDFGDGKGFKPIGNGWDDEFEGNFDGNGYNITGLTIKRTLATEIGLFSVVGSGVLINNTRLLDVNIHGKDYVGGLVGKNYNGTISNSYSSGNISGKISSGSSPNYFVGGLIGYNSLGIISNSSSTGRVSGDPGAGKLDALGGLVDWNEYGEISNSYATGDVSGSAHVGGLAGENYGGTVSNSYSKGYVLGNYYVGGFIGSNNQGIISDSYSTGSV